MNALATRIAACLAPYGKGACVFVSLTANRPSVTSTLDFAQAVRRYLMGIHARIAGGPERVSPRFSGKDREGRPLAGHRHAYFLPMDLDRDGWLDHLVVHCLEPFDESERVALSKLERVWLGEESGEIRLTPAVAQPGGGPGQPGPYSAHSDGAFFFSRRVSSATPFVPPRHYRKGRGEFSAWLAAELQREAVNHGLPALLRVTPLPALERGGRAIAWTEFTRSRKNDRMQIGYGFELEFSEPVRGPLALGYGCHFGLGQFVPAR